MAAERQSETDERGEGMGKAVKRRGLIAGAALVAGIAAKQTAQPVAAATGTSFNATGSNTVAFAA